MLVRICDDECMHCGTKKNLTRHHCIPRRMNPKNNILIQLCENCHTDIHSNDIEGLKGRLTATFHQFKKFINKTLKITHNIDCNEAVIANTIKFKESKR